MSQVDYTETARELLQAGASRKVIEQTLVKQGASEELATKLTLEARRSPMLKGMVVFVPVAAALIFVGYKIFGWLGVIFFAFVSSYPFLSIWLGYRDWVKGS